MQIRNSVVCDAIKGCIYKQIKPPLVGEHAFPLMGFVCWSAHVTSVYRFIGPLLETYHTNTTNLSNLVLCCVTMKVGYKF